MLHIVTNPASVQRCFEHLHDDDTVLLTGDGVYAAHDLDVPPARDVFVLGQDLDARGARLASGVQRADMGLFVELVVRHTSSVTWS